MNDANLPIREPKERNARLINRVPPTDVSFYVRATANDEKRNPRTDDDDVPERPRSYYLERIDRRTEDTSTRFADDILRLILGDRRRRCGGGGGGGEMGELLAFRGVEKVRNGERGNIRGTMKMT